MEHTTAAESERPSVEDLPRPSSAVSSSSNNLLPQPPLLAEIADSVRNTPGDASPLKEDESTASLDATAAENGLETIEADVTEQMGVTEMEGKMAKDFHVAFKGDSAERLDEKNSNLWTESKKESKKVKSRSKTPVMGFNEEEGKDSGPGKSGYLNKVLNIMLGTKSAAGEGEQAPDDISIQSNQKLGISLTRKQRGVRDREERWKKMEIKRRAKLLYLDTAATIHMRITNVHKLTRCYLRGLAMASYFLFFVMVLITVSRYSAIYSVVSSIASAYLPIMENNMVEERSSIQNWLGGQVNRVWLDPVCGNGVCEAPFEFPSFQDFGCRMDCGEDRTIVEVVLVLQADFTLAPEFTTASEAMASASWNLCQVVEERRTAGMDDLCWYPKVQRFERLKTSALLPFSLRSGEWYMQVRGDYFGLVGGLLLDASVASNLTTVVMEPAWETCTASDDDDVQPAAGSGRHHRRLLDEASEWMDVFNMDKGGDAPYQGLEGVPAYHGLETAVSM